MKQFTDAEFAALTTEQRKELRNEFCVYNDGSQRFKDTLVKFFIEKDEDAYDGSTEEHYYHFPAFSARTITQYPHNPIITINQFCELFPEYSDVKKPQLSDEDIEAIAKSVVTMIASGNTIKGSDGVEYQVTVVEQPKNEYEHLVGKWVRCTNVDKNWNENIKVNSWNKVLGVEKKFGEGLDFGGYWGKCSFFDLDNPLDYNPETLVGKYYKGNQIESIYFPNDIPCFHMNKGVLGFYCSGIDLSEVTDAPPTPEPSYKLEDIVEIVKPAYYLVSNGNVRSLLSSYKDVNQFPKESQGKQVAALCQLFTLMQWANEGRERKEGEYVYQPYMSPGEIYLMQTISNYSPIYFFDYEKGRKLIETSEHLFKDFLGV